MTAPPLRRAAANVILFGILLFAQRAAAVEALLLQDTCVDSRATGDDPPPNKSNYGAGMDLRVFKGNGRIGRAFLKFSLETLPPGTTAADVTHARLRLWVNQNSTAAGSITLRPVISAWDEYKLTHSSAAELEFGATRLADLPIDTINSFVSIDVTDWVRSWLAATLPNEGITIEPGQDTDFLDLSFDSKESNLTAHEARLEISLKN